MAAWARTVRETSTRAATDWPRARTWPATANPHLFINLKTAPRLNPVSRPFPRRQVNLAPQTLREDRILSGFPIWAIDRSCSSLTASSE